MHLVPLQSVSGCSVHRVGVGAPRKSVEDASAFKAFDGDRRLRLMTDRFGFRTVR